MRKIYAFLLLSALICTPLFGDSEVSTGAFIALKESKTTGETYVPSYFFIEGIADYMPTKNLMLSAELSTIYGEPDAQLRSLNLANAYTSYFNNRTRLHASYTFKDITLGAINTLQLNSTNEKSAADISQGPMPFRGTRDYYLLQEFYLKGTISKKFFFTLSTGFESQLFNIKDSNPNNTQTVEMEDNNTLFNASISYKSTDLFVPFVRFSYFSDMNKSDMFNLYRLHSGVRGTYKFSNDLNIHYNVFYRRLESELITDNDRMVTYIRGRYHVTSSTDIFLWLYNEDNSKRYINRNITLLIRQWLNISKLTSYFSIGSKVELEKNTDTNYLYYPLTAFVQLYAKLYGALFRMRYSMRYNEKTYRDIATNDLVYEYAYYKNRLEASLSYSFWKLSPTFGFYMHDFDDPLMTKAYGIKLFVTAVF